MIIKQFYIIFVVWKTQIMLGMRTMPFNGCRAKINFSDGTVMLGKDKFTIMYDGDKRDKTAV